MNISAIQTFLSVVRNHNLIRAAEELQVTQSAVTARLDALDQRMGVRLLVRSRKGASLTKAGFAFLEQAEVIVRNWDIACTRLKLPKGATEMFSFTCHPALWKGWGETWIRDIRRDHNPIAIEVWSGLASDAKNWMASGMSDAALLPSALLGPEFYSRLFAVEPLLQVSSVPRSVQRWDTGYIYVDYGPSFRIQHAEEWPNVETAAIAFSEPNWALSHLLTYGGSAYLPESMIRSYLTDKELFIVEGALAFEREIFLSWCKNSKAAFNFFGGDGGH